jgi:glycosyltransferase involved in cell wall biosynthesis
MGAEPNPSILHIMTVPQSLNTFLRGQIAFVKEAGFDIEAAASAAPLLQEFGDREGIRTFEIPIPRSINPIGDARAVFAACRLLRDRRPDIVHAGTPQGGLIGMIAAWLCRTPVRIYHIRGLPFMTESGARRRMLKTTEWISCRLATRVLCVSHGIKAVAVEEHIAPGSKITVLCGGSGNGVDAEVRFNPDRFTDAQRLELRKKLGIPEDALVIGYVGRFHGIKGIGELAAAWSIVREQIPNAVLVAVGGRDTHDPAPADALAKLDSDSRVIQPGSVPDTAPFYGLFDVLAFPTYREGLPNVLLEAGAMRVPVVATDIPGNSDVVIPGQTGMLVPVHDSRALAEGLISYLEHPRDREAAGIAARTRVRSAFEQTAIWSELVALYRRELAAAKGR